MNNQKILKVLILVTIFVTAFLIIAIKGVPILVSKLGNKYIENKFSTEESVIEVYLKDNLTAEEITNLKNKLENISGITIKEYITKEQAYYKALEKVGNDVIDAGQYTEKAHPFPASFIITINDKSKKDEIINKIEKFNNVRGVRDAEDFMN